MAEKATLTEVLRYFEYPNPTDFRKDWSQLTPEDGDQLKTGIGDGSFTY